MTKIDYGIKILISIISFPQHNYLDQQQATEAK